MRKATRGAIIALSLASLSLSSCSFFKKIFGGGGDAPSVEGCPKDALEVSRLAWGLEEPYELDIKAGLLGSIHLDKLAGGMNEELKEACGDLAKQLFVSEKDLEPEEFRLGAEANLACSKADEAIAKLKGIAGGSVKITAGVPLCSTPLSAANDCLAACRVVPKKKKDREALGPQPTADCEGELSGACAGNCSGQCTIADEGECSGICAGLCEGTCESEFTGQCRGKCEGTCDGAKVEGEGECAGTCQGRCLEAARGTCGGTCIGSCGGSCTMQAAGQCDGICAGECDKALKDKQCTGILRLAGKGNSECEAACDTIVLAKMTCIPPVVKVKVEDFENEEAAGLIERALSQHLPKILAARALNIEQERVDQAGARSKITAAAMKKAAGNKDLELEKKHKVCIEETAAVESEANAALPALLDAGNIARSATSGN